MQLITLSGNKEENYYQLGLKDRPDCGDIFLTTSALIKSTNIISRQIKNFSSALIFKKNIRNYSLIKAYAEGLGKSESELISFLITPDIISGLTSIFPNIPRVLYGCSSYFYLNENKNLSHFRILDFPLGETYTKNERFIRYNFTGERQYCGFSTAGFPFPSITSMNDSGLTFALHQKFGHVFNTEGLPIFEIMENLVSGARDLKDIQSEIKNISSISTWGILVGSQKDKKVLAIDLLGNESTSEIFDVTSDCKHYFNNNFLSKNIDTKNIQPLNFSNYCLDRHADAKKRITKIKKFDDNNVLKALTKVQMSDDKNTVITPSTILSCVMNEKEQKIIFNQGVGPRTYQKLVHQITDIWKTPQLNEPKVAATTSKSEGEIFFEHLIRAQLSWDKKNYHKAIHHAQLAVNFSSKKQILPKFFAIILIALSTDDKSLLKDCLKKLSDIRPSLTGVFCDYCKLFIFRMERICFSKYESQDIENQYVRHIYEFEKKVPQIIFKKIVRELTSPRVDLQDIIFLHPLKNDNPEVIL